MEEIEQFVLTSDEENLTFTKKQIEYLQDEFERQRRWVNLLSTREKLNFRRVGTNTKFYQLSFR